MERKEWIRIKGVVSCSTQDCYQIAKWLWSIDASARCDKCRQERSNNGVQEQG